MRKLIIILSLTVIIQISYIVFTEIKNDDLGEFENKANVFTGFEDMDVSGMFSSKNRAYVYFDSKKAKEHLKKLYAHLSPYINQTVIEGANGKYLLGYNYNTYAVIDGLGDLRSRSSALYGYKNIYSMDVCRQKAEEFLTENNIMRYTLNKHYDFCGVYYFKYKYPDGKFITVGIDKEYCEVKFLDQ